MLIHQAICNAQASSRQKHVDLTVGPVREALANYDADAALVTDIRQAFSGLNWVRFINSAPDRDGSSDELNKIIDAGDNPYLGMLDCQYVISGQYDSIWAKCFVEIAKKDIPSLENPADRWNEDFLVFFKQVEVQVGLAHYADDQGAREAQWLTNSAAPLKRAIGIAMESVAKLSARAVSAEQGDVEHWKEAKRKSMGHYLDNHDYVVVSGSDNIIKQTGQNCFNRKNKSSIRVDSDGVTTEDVHGNLYICQGFTP